MTYKEAMNSMRNQVWFAELTCMAASVTLEAIALMLSALQLFFQIRHKRQTRDDGYVSAGEARRLIRLCSSSPSTQPRPFPSRRLIRGRITEL